MISVLMSTYQEKPAVLKNSIESILNQEYKGSKELILIIDNPDNITLTKWLKSNYKKNNEIKIIENQRNLGLAKSLNIAIDNAQGNYVCRMDADDKSHPDRLQKQLSFLKRNNLDLIGSKINTYDERGKFLYRTPDLPSTPSSVAKASRWNNCLPHPTWFGKKEVFSIKYRNIPLCEDYDFQLRAILNGFKLGNINEPLLDYSLSNNSISRSNLYSQFLYQKYIAFNYSKGKVAQIDDAKSYVRKSYNKDKARRYNKAYSKFNSGTSKLQSKKLFTGSLEVISSSLTSLNFANKVRRLLIATIIAKMQH